MHSLHFAVPSGKQYINVSIFVSSIDSTLHYVNMKISCVPLRTKFISYTESEIVETTRIPDKYKHIISYSKYADIKDLDLDSYCLPVILTTRLLTNGPDYIESFIMLLKDCYRNAEKLHEEILYITIFMSYIMAANDIDYGDSDIKDLYAYMLENNVLVSQDIFNSMITEIHTMVISDFEFIEQISLCNIIRDKYRVFVEYPNYSFEDVYEHVSAYLLFAPENVDEPESPVVCTTPRTVFCVKYENTTPNSINDYIIRQ